MKIAVVYTAVCNGPLTPNYVSRFVASYFAFSAEIDHDLIVCCNGGPLPTEIALMLAPTGARMFARHNDGWDIGGYLDASRGPCANYDMMLCLGESIYFWRPGWLRRFVETRKKYGEGMYGCFSSNAIRPHLNTTGFFCSPVLLRLWPRRISTKADRYNFEHGEQSFWRWVAARSLPVRLVTWDGDYEPRQWRMPRNILWRGDQSNCLLWTNHCDNWEKLDPLYKQKWSKFADSPFK